LHLKVTRITCRFSAFLDKTISIKFQSNLRGKGRNHEKVLDSFSSCELASHQRGCADLGQWFGATLTESEVRYLMSAEWAVTAEDVVWRRSKLGLRLSVGEIAALDEWMAVHYSEGERPLREAGGRT